MDCEEYYNLGEKCYIKGEYEKAIYNFNKCIAISNSEDWVFDSQNYIGCCYLNLCDYNSAIKILRELINEYPYYEVPVISLGRVYLKQKRFQDAFQCFEKAVLLNLENQDAYYYMGVYYYKINNIEQASKCYEKSISLDFEQAETHLNLGNCYADMNLHEKAIEEYDISYSIDNSSVDALYNKALVLSETKNYTMAIETLLYLDEIERNNIENMTIIAELYLEIQDFESATMWIDKCLLLDSNDLSAKKLSNTIYTLKREKLKNSFKII